MAPGIKGMGVGGGPCITGPHLGTQQLLALGQRHYIPGDMFWSLIYLSGAPTNMCEYHKQVDSLGFSGSGANLEQTWIYINNVLEASCFLEITLSQKF